MKYPGKSFGSVLSVLVLMSIHIADAANVVPANAFVIPDGKRLQKREIGHVPDDSNRASNNEPLFHIQNDGSVLSEDFVHAPGKSEDSLSFEPSVPDGEAPQGGPTLLRTKLAVNRDASIFASYVRDFTSIEDRLDSTSSVSLILAPTDDAVSALPTKPWEFPNSVPKGDEKAADKAIRSNVKSFILSHLYLGNIEDGAGTFGFESANGLRITVVRDDNDKLTVSTRTSAGKEIKANVVSVTEADNGKIWLLDSSLVRP